MAPFFAMYTEILWLLPEAVSKVTMALMICLAVAAVCVSLPAVVPVQPVEMSPSVKVPATFTGVAVDAIVVAVELPVIETAA
jgi:hypothetical protein